ncbi:MAG: 4-alpha-glucanotransferase [Actinomycetota bacterium]|nr:4-alpha-glucanotransferase [Actinomycetota bacterium]
MSEPRASEPKSDPAAWGIAPGYQDTNGEQRRAPSSTVDAILAAMGSEGRPTPPGEGRDDPVWVVGRGQSRAVEGWWRLRTEEGADLAVEGSLPPDLPLGYHHMRREEDGHHRLLVVSPGVCFLPEQLRTWGWAVQLYALRSARSWGMGDLADLGRLARWSSEQGAGVVIVNPLHAPLPTPSQQASPYYPSSRCFRNPLYLRVEDVPGAHELGADLEGPAAAGRALNGDRRIDRDAVWRLKMDALERLWEGFGGDPAFEAYCAEQGPALAAYATFCVLVEHHGAPWWDWPTGLRDPEGPEILGFVEEHHRRIRFHQWLQWLADVQLESAGEQVGLIQDLAIGVDPAGADAWLWQDCIASGVKVGAPPDAFNTQGQDWGLPPFDPWRLRAAAYEPYIRTLRAGFRHAGGLRIDHVMGLFRLFWIPAGAGPAEGTYVRYPYEETLGILALESQRAGAFVVGEDLGTVEDFVREELGRRDVLSYRLMWFEDEPPRRFPLRSLAAVTTHDLPTVAGLWSGTDMEEQQRLGLDPNVEGSVELRRRLADWSGVDDDAPVREAVLGAYELLAEAPSAVVTPSLDDALLVSERPNVPGTTEERPNWSLALPKLLEEVEADPTVAEVAATLGRHRRS